MPLLIAQLAILIAIVFVIGCLFGHIIRGRKAHHKDEERTIISAALASPVPAESVVAQAVQIEADPIVDVIAPEMEDMKLVPLAEEAAPETVIAIPDAEPVGMGAQEVLVIKPEDIGKPELLTAPQNGKADDLTSVKGIGKAIEGMLNGLGVFHYTQIAKWDGDETLWIEREIGFAGRVSRESWGAQAAKLSDGKAKPAVKRVVKAKTAAKTGTRKRASAN